MKQVYEYNCEEENIPRQYHRNDIDISNSVNISNQFVTTKLQSVDHYPTSSSFDIDLYSLEYGNSQLNTCRDVELRCNRSCDKCCIQEDFDYFVNNSNRCHQLGYCECSEAGRGQSINDINPNYCESDFQISSDYSSSKLDIFQVMHECRCEGVDLDYSITPEENITLCQENISNCLSGELDPWMIVTNICPNCTEYICNCSSSSLFDDSLSDRFNENTDSSDSLSDEYVSEHSGDDIISIYDTPSPLTPSYSQYPFEPFPAVQSTPSSLIVHNSEYYECQWDSDIEELFPVLDGMSIDDSHVLSEKSSFLDHCSRHMFENDDEKRYPIINVSTKHDRYMNISNELNNLFQMNQYNSHANTFIPINYLSANHFVNYLYVQVIVHIYLATFITNFCLKLYLQIMIDYIRIICIQIKLR